MEDTKERFRALRGTETQGRMLRRKRVRQAKGSHAREADRSGD